MKLEYNYHTHTPRCGHAIGKEEDYILEAIKMGIKRLGFSDHIILPEQYEQPGIRGDYKLYQDYVDTIKALKEKYKDQIEIKLGFEAEYIPTCVDYYKKILKKDIDYLILGQHCFFDGKWRFYPYDNNSVYGIKLYVDHIIAGLQTGLFSYLVHPDLFMMGYDVWNDEMEQEARRLLKACEDMNIPIEINVLGMTRNYNGQFRCYPNDHFFALVKDYNLKIVIGVDAHMPSHFNLANVEKAFQFAEKHHLKVDLDFAI